MNKRKFGVVVFPGSNCDRDIIHVLDKVMGQEVHVLWHKDKALPGFTKNDCVILPGGFSYGDYLRPGAIAQFSPIMEEVINFTDKGGTLIGICNGFQILCELGLLPGVLLRNSSQKFICRNTYIKTITGRSSITAGIEEGKVLKIPIAHADGKYFAEEATIQQMKANDQILFQYCDAEGRVTAEANPNGSVDNIAGICNKDRNVIGMMPHPERAAEEALGNTDGKLLFESLINQTKAAVV